MIRYLNLHEVWYKSHVCFWGVWKSSTQSQEVTSKDLKNSTQSQGFFWRVSRAAALNHKVFIFVKSSKSTQSQNLWNGLKNVNLGEVGLWDGPNYHLIINGNKTKRKPGFFSQSLLPSFPPLVYLQCLVFRLLITQPRVVAISFCFWHFFGGICIPTEWKASSECMFRSRTSQDPGGRFPIG